MRSAPRAGVQARQRTPAGARHGAGDHRLRVRREARAVEDGYSCALVPGLRASADAVRLAQELAFSAARLQALTVEPPGLYGQARAVDLEEGTWICVVTACVGPAEGEDPFAGARRLLAGAPDPQRLAGAEELSALLEEVQLGARGCESASAVVEALSAYRDWLARHGGPAAGGEAGGPQAQAFDGDPQWTAERRFERLYERLALRGTNRAVRYDLLVTLGRLGLYELRADSLHLGSGRGVSPSDAATDAAKRVFGIGDPMLLDRRAKALAQAASLPIEALDLALFNWGATQRAGGGIDPREGDETAEQLAREALGL